MTMQIFHSAALHEWLARLDILPGSGSKEVTSNKIGNNIIFRMIIEPCNQGCS